MLFIELNFIQVQIWYSSTFNWLNINIYKFGHDKALLLAVDIQVIKLSIKSENIIIFVSVIGH